MFFLCVVIVNRYFATIQVHIKISGRLRKAKQHSGFCLIIAVINKRKNQTDKHCETSF
jgi:hypothetical protein